MGIFIKNAQKILGISQTVPRRPALVFKEQDLLAFLDKQNIQGSPMLEPEGIGSTPPPTLILYGLAALVAYPRPVIAIPIVLAGAGTLARKPLGRAARFAGQRLNRLISSYAPATRRSFPHP